jgi:hypothetical protein
VGADQAGLGEERSSKLCARAKREIGFTSI